MRTAVTAAVLALLASALLAPALWAGSEAYVTVTNDAPYPVMAEVIHIRKGTVAEAPVLPGESMRIVINPGRYILSLRPVIPFYFIGLSVIPGALLKDPYVLIPLELGPGGECEYTYEVGNLSKVGAGIAVLKSTLKISVIVVDDAAYLKAGSFPDGSGGYYSAVLIMGDGNHTLFIAFSEDDPVLCMMRYRLELEISAGDVVTIEAPQNLSRYVKQVNITNTLKEPVTVEIEAAEPTLVNESMTRTDPSWLIAYTPSKEVTIPPGSSIAISACAGTYRVRAWGTDPPRVAGLEAVLNLSGPSPVAEVTVPDSMGGGALTIRPGPCVSYINVSVGNAPLSLTGKEAATLLLPSGDYTITAELGDCDIINAPSKYSTTVSVQAGNDVTVEVPPPPATITVRNGAGYDLVVSVVNSTGGLAYAATLYQSSTSTIEVWPGNYTLVANPLTRPDNYVGPVSRMRWETSVSLGGGEATELVARPSASATLEIEGPPGTEVLIDWGTSSANYVIPPDGVLKLSAAPGTYRISSCPSDIFHSCWSVTVSPLGESRVVVEYGLRPDAVAATGLGAAGAAVLAYLLVWRARTRRTRLGGTAAPP